MKQQLHNLAYHIVSLGLVGVLPAARLWASLLGVLFLWGVNGVALLSSTLAWGLFFVALFCMFALSWYVRQDISEEREADIVLDRIAGTALALVGLPSVTVKFLLFGFALFHFWLFMSVLGQRVYCHDNKTVSGNVILTAGEIALIALMTNGTLRFLWWLTH
jgi:hypothetical protein